MCLNLRLQGESRKHTHSWYLQVDLVILALITI